MPKLSVIIPTCHRNDLLALCLDRLAPGEQILGSEFYEVIVSDDGRSSTAEDMIRERYPWAKWVMGPQRGPAANRNNGVRQANDDWVVFTDDDCLPDPVWLQAYYQAIHDYTDTSIFEGKTYADRAKNYPWEEAPVNIDGGKFWSCNIAFNKKVFFDIGGFDEDFPYAKMEDLELFHRVKKKKYNITFIENASIMHPWRLRKNDWLDPAIKSMKIFLSKHPEMKEIFSDRHFVAMGIQKLKSCFQFALKLKMRESFYEFFEAFKFFKYSYKI